MFLTMVLSSPKFMDSVQETARTSVSRDTVSRTEMLYLGVTAVNGLAGAAVRNYL